MAVIANKPLIRQSMDIPRTTPSLLICYHQNTARLIVIIQCHNARALRASQVTRPAINKKWRSASKDLPIQVKTQSIGLSEKPILQSQGLHDFMDRDSHQPRREAGETFFWPRPRLRFQPRNCPAPSQKSASPLVGARHFHFLPIWIPSLVRSLGRGVDAGRAQASIDPSLGRVGFMKGIWGLGV